MSTIDITAREIDARQLQALRAFLEALNIKYELTPHKPYDKKFVKMILQGDKDLKKGKGKKMSRKELPGLWK
ncbi:MAG: DUF2683 family protein [Flavobacteriales bacterium]